ncbi:MAG TPA: stage II sporulation protein M [Candidatus Angelobacter sp.]
MSLGTMISTYWLEKRQSHWKRLELLLDQVKNNGLRSLTRAELQELGLLYRQAAADLSTLREDVTGKSYARTLNVLLSRAHNTIYAGEKSSARGVLHFYRHTYPRVFRDNLRLITVAFLLFAAGAAVGTLLTFTRPEYMRYFLGPGMMETIERHKMWTDSVVAVSPAASSGIMTNNIAVSFMMFAWGITAGAGTVLSLFYNGLLIGVIGTACGLNDMSLSLWSFVAPHGVLELPAIFIAGGSGLRLAQGILFPGLLSRHDSLAKAGEEAVRLLVGVIPILIVAGLIEGFISPSALGWQWKFAMAGSVGVIFFSYLFFCARGGAAPNLPRSFLDDPVRSAAAGSAQ